MADYTGRGQSFWAFKCSVEHEAEGDRVFAEPQRGPSAACAKSPMTG